MSRKTHKTLNWYLVAFHDNQTTEKLILMPVHERLGQTSYLIYDHQRVPTAAIKFAYYLRSYCL